VSKLKPAKAFRLAIVSSATAWAGKFWKAISHYDPRGQASLL
jgi:hypothetical protein